MASVLICSAELTTAVRQCVTNGKIEVAIGLNASFYLSREEAAQLAADLLDAIDSQKVAA